MSNDFDNLAREKIKTEIFSNFFVEAGAGSGKTTVLVDRMVAMVEGGIDISKICAITFTKAAANEFYARFYKKLSESTSELAKNALKNIDLCFMGTIDSFCQMILSEHPAEANIPSNAEITSDEKMRAYYIKEMSLIQRGERGTDLREKCKQFKKHFYSAEDTFVEGITFLLNTRNAHFNYIPPPNGKPDDLFVEERNRIIPILKKLCIHPEAFCSDSKSITSEGYLRENIESLCGSWNSNLENVIYTLKKIHNIRLSADFDVEQLGANYSTIFTPVYNKKEKLTHWGIIDEKVGDPLAIKALSNYLVEIALDFIANSVDTVSMDLRAEGKLGYFDYLFYLRELLKNDALKGGKVTSHIFDRHSYFLVDEFQDTNPLQAEIFFTLTASEPNADWRKCKPKPGSLFIVGDPKQSIYRFRNADVPSYLKVKKLFEQNAGEVLYLTRNFRSTDNLCNWFNKTFQTLLPEDTEVQSAYKNVPIGEKTEYKASFEGVFEYIQPHTLSIAASDEPRRTAEIIRSIVDNPNITIQDSGPSAVPRRPKFSDFMVITPRKTHLYYYMRELDSYGIPYRIEGKVLFGECPSLVSIHLLMNAIANPRDKSAVYAAKHASGVFVTEARIWELFRISQSMSPVALFSKLLDEERVFAKVGAENAEYAYYAIELLRKAEISGEVVSLKDSCLFLEKLILGETDEERCAQLTQENDCVHIANVHKVKGLEAPIVILANPRGSPKTNRSRIDYSKDTPQSYLFFLNNLAYYDFYEEMEAEDNAERAEKMRLVYVAATRAANALIVALDQTSDGTPTKNNPWQVLNGSIEQDVFSVVGLSKCYVAPQKETRSIDELYDLAESKHNLFTDQKSYEIKKPSTSAAIPIEQNSVCVVENERLAAKNDSALLGTMIHKLLENIVLSKGSLNIESMIQCIISDYSANPNYASILKQVGLTMLSGGYIQSNSVPADLLKELFAAEEVYCEVPFAYFENAADLWNGIMDVVYCKEGKWHIVDYKTNADSNDLDQKYRGQLDAYVNAFRSMTGKDADAYIYHISV